MEMSKLIDKPDCAATGSTNLSSWYRLVENAAKAKFGENIKLCIHPELVHDRKVYCKDLVQQTNKFVDDLVFKVLTCGSEPMQMQPCMIDSITNEFRNVGDTHQLESFIKASKNTTMTKGTRYHFQITEGQGVDFGRNYDLGVQIVSINMSGGRMRIRDTRTLLWDQKYNSGLEFRYDHKEKLIIPPLTAVVATVTTSTKIMEQEYTLEFHTKRDRGIWVKYLTPFQQNWRCLLNCCCCCEAYSQGFLSAKEILKTLPDYRREGKYCYFSLEGTLRWIIEDGKIETSEIKVT